MITSVYGPLLQRCAPPPNPEELWLRLWRTKLNRPARVSLAEFNRSAEIALSTFRAAAWERGVMEPAPYWPAIAAGMLPELQELKSEEVIEFLYAHAQLERRLRLTPGADRVLYALKKRGLSLGIVSNGQAFTPMELAMALHSPHEPIESSLPAVSTCDDFDEAAMARLPEIFTPALCFWAFAAGYGKPNPHVFQHVHVRLRMRAIAPEETLMVGVTVERDLHPARKFGWKTWRFATDAEAAADTGDWQKLAVALGCGAGMERRAEPCTI